MTTNSRTWFYNEPEHRPYYVEERVNQTLWANRFGSIYFSCTRAEPPFQMVSGWENLDITIEWQPNSWFVLRTSAKDEMIVNGFSQVLQLLPSVTYTQDNGTVVTEWFREESAGKKRLQEIRSSANFFEVTAYKR